MFFLFLTAQDLCSHHCQGSDGQGGDPGGGHNDQNRRQGSGGPWQGLKLCTVAAQCTLATHPPTLHSRMVSQISSPSLPSCQSCATRCRQTSLYLRCCLATTYNSGRRCPILITYTSALGLYFCIISCSYTILCCVYSTFNTSTQ